MHYEPAEPDAGNLEAGLDEDLGFGRAVVVGTIVGIVAMVAGVTLVVHLLVPDWPIGSVLAISVWTGVWAGLFLGGTVTVGRWSGRRH